MDIREARELLEKKRIRRMKLAGIIRDVDELEFDSTDLRRQLSMLETKISAAEKILSDYDYYQREEYRIDGRLDNILPFRPNSREVDDLRRRDDELLDAMEDCLAKVEIMLL